MKLKTREQALVKVFSFSFIQCNFNHFSFLFSNNIICEVWGAMNFYLGCWLLGTFERMCYPSKSMGYNFVLTLLFFPSQSRFDRKRFGICSFRPGQYLFSFGRAINWKFILCISIYWHIQYCDSNFLRAHHNNFHEMKNWIFSNE